MIHTELANKILGKAAKEKLEIALFAFASRRGGRKGGSGGIPLAEPVARKISSDFFKYTPPLKKLSAISPQLKLIADC